MNKNQKYVFIVTLYVIQIFGFVMITWVIYSILKIEKVKPLILLKNIFMYLQQTILSVLR